MTSLKPGDMVKNRYRIIRQLDSGGWGTVHLAQDENLHLQVAIKSLKRRPDLEDYGQVCRLFEQEARISTRVDNHPNIIRVRDLVKDDYDLHLVMDYAEGGSLADRLKATGVLPIGEALDVSIALCQALDYAHRRGIVHADVRPSNILLAVDKEITGEHINYKLSDFGFAVDIQQQNEDEDTSHLTVFDHRLAAIESRLIRRWSNVF